MKLSRYCICGAAMQVKSEPAALAEFLGSEFDKRHTGSGHAQCTPAQAARVRARKERAVLRDPEGGAET